MKQLIDGRNFDLILFDLNGTLLNDMPAWEKAMRATFKGFGAEPPTTEQYFRELEGDYAKVYEKRGITATRDDLNKIYEKVYLENLDGVAVIREAKVLFNFLKFADIKIGVVTTQKEELAAPFFKDVSFNKFNIPDIFRFHVLNKKEVIRELCENEGVDSERCLYVGDAPSDIRHARAANVKACVYLNGYIPEDLLSQNNPDIIIGHFFRLVDHVVSSGSDKTNFIYK